MRRIGLALALILLCVVFSSRNAQAESQTDKAVNFAVDFFAASGSAVGITIP